ncbi:hypothetical protein PTKIN_Ptkin10aG0180900 [Pterospermum kingtungense]
MEEIQFNDTGEEEVIGGDDDFYEEIEAPKYVDLTAPDRFLNENDDRHWFCIRVGCDQKHGEEMDSEAIYKNFVLRVMAARSPSVRLRKALYNKDSSSNLRCPQTVPAKSSKSRVSRLAMISSISHKMGDAKVKVRPVPKQSVTTPNVKPAKQVSTKALTAPRNNKGLSNPGAFRSVRNPKPTTIEVPKNRVVAKALVFHSPKKSVKLKKSVELRKICAGMKKLEVTEKNTMGCDKALGTSRKQFRGREVKSRVYDCLHSQNQKKQEPKSLKCLKKKDSTEKEIEAKSKDGSLEDCSNERLEQAMDEKVEFSCPLRSDMTCISICEGNYKPCSKDKEIIEAMETDDKESESKVMEIDDKENASAFDINRLDCTTGKLVKNDVLGKHEASKSTQKVTKVTSTLKENSSAVNGAQGMKNRKPKITNPKPFRLRTDERRILKEANLEKKHLQAPVKETIFPGSQGGNSWRKHQNVQRNEKCLGQIETVNYNYAHEGSDNESDRRTLKDQPKKSEGRLEKTKLSSSKQLVRPRGVASSRKKLVSLVKPGQLGVIKEMSPTMSRPKVTSNPDETGTSSAPKASLCNASRPSPQRRRRHTTIPKEPNFHSIHVPKSCTRRVL